MKITGQWFYSYTFGHGRAKVRRTLDARGEMDGFSIQDNFVERTYEARVVDKEAARMVIGRLVRYTARAANVKWLLIAGYDPVLSMSDGGVSLLFRMGKEFVDPEVSFFSEKSAEKFLEVCRGQIEELRRRRPVSRAFSRPAKPERRKDGAEQDLSSGKDLSA